ncbi:MAG: hypothetical protein A2122_01045 [Candidatus Liptonbacteria bacterium GWB1_49_6]|uniref:Glycosyltransferase subfamily 4-like N-terminal domain-containing protein n=1 Tax=Candidatus Liptonbacteria bacterium GWB1_49_6 TaxID=1798644 RepID=A0A1G2C6C6_9BACT|nr:MAG: hypothetical protein A2122_01045 [Candidatus Liptonbacteria bacterium GWB1_49_6]
MNISIFSDNFYPEISGVSDSITSLARELSARGHNVRFYVPAYSRKDYKKGGVTAENPPLGPCVEFRRLFSVPYPTPTGQGRAIIPTGLRSISLRDFRPDIIHTQLFFGAGIEALIASRILKKPLVGTNHTALKEFLKYSPVRAAWAENLALRYVNWYYGQCEAVTAPSRSVIEEMEFFGFKKEARIISNPIDTKLFAPSANKNIPRKKFGFPEYTVIHAGRLGEERKIDVIIRALALAKKKIPSLALAIAGRGADEGRLRNLAASLGIRNAVRFLGFLNHKTLAEAYNASSVFAITSTADTQSMVMMQAMACGIPVVGVKARGIPEYIHPQNGYLIEPDNPSALAEKIIFLFKNPAKRKDLGRGARAFAEKFSAASIAEEWEMLYKKVIEQYAKKHRKA